MSDKLKQLRDNNPIVDMVAGFIPGVGEALDIHDFYHSFKKKDLGGMALASVGFFLPGITGVQIRNADEISAGLKKLGLEVMPEPNKTLGTLVRDLNDNNKTKALTALIKRRPEVAKLFEYAMDYGYDLKAVLNALLSYIDNAGKLALDYPGLARMIEQGDPKALEILENAKKIVNNEGLPFINGGVPDPLSVARAQGLGTFNLGYRGDAPISGKRKFSNSFGGYFFLTLGEKAKKAAMAYSHFENPKLIQLMVEEAGFPQEIAKRAHDLSKQIHELNKELGIKEFTITGAKRQTVNGFTGSDVKFQYQNQGLLRPKTKSGKLVDELLNEYTLIGEELTNMFKYTPTGLQIGQVKQYLFKNKSPINSEVIIDGSGNYNDIQDLSITKKVGTRDITIPKKQFLKDGKYNISTMESFFGKDGVDKLSINGIANPIPGVNTIGVNPDTVTLIYKKGNKLCKR